MEPLLDVVIPARGETGTLVRCLNSLLGDAAGVNLRVLVVANGSTRQPTLHAALGLARVFLEAGIEFSVLEEPEAGKTNAMNRGDLQTRGDAVMYLDADTVILPGTLGALGAMLAESADPLLISPRPRFVLPREWPARHWAKVWRTLPAVAGEVVGSGCYAVNPPGRARWTLFPHVLGDDSFVRSRFSRAERQQSSAGGVLVVIPETRNLVASLRRWREASKELREIPPVAAMEARKGRGSDPGAGLARNLRHLLLRADLWAFLPAFVAVCAAARWGGTWTAERGHGSHAWTPMRQ